jgi:hypothetical protein
LYYSSLGNIAAFDADQQPRADGTFGTVNKGPFSNLSNQVFWNNLSSADPASPDENAWQFNTGTGASASNGKINLAAFGWAVRPADTAPVPVPAAVWLFGSAVTGFGFSARRRKTA